MNHLWNCCMLEIEKICGLLPMLLMLPVVNVFVTLYDLVPVLLLMFLYWLSA